MACVGPFGSSFGSRDSVFDHLLYLTAMYQITANLEASSKILFINSVLQVRNPGSLAVFSAQGLTKIMSGISHQGGVLFLDWRNQLSFLSLLSGYQIEKKTIFK